MKSTISEIMNRDLPQDQQPAPRDTADMRAPPEYGFRNELLPKPSRLQTLLWSMAIGSPLTLGPAVGAYAFLATPTGGDFYGFALILNTGLGFAIGVVAGIVLAVLFYLFVIRRFSDAE
jgi:hypothetical protein